MNERQMQTLWGKHIQKHPPEFSEVWELKFTKSTNIRFDSVAEHQIESLIKAKWNEGLYHRITDQPWLKDRKNTYTLKKPFDCFYLKMTNAYVVLWFYKPREKKVFIKIDIDNWYIMSRNSGRKSITEQMALQFGIPIQIDVK